MKRPPSSRRSSANVTRGLAATAACAVVGASAFALPAAAQAAPGPTEHTDLGVTGAAVYEHLEVFSDLALQYADEGYRAYNSPGYEAAAEYVEEVLEGTGAFETERQYFTVEGESNGAIDFTVAGDEVPAFHVSYGEGTDEPIVDAPLSVTSDEAGIGCSPDDYADVPEGSILLVQRGECPFYDKAFNGTQAGAAAVVIYNNEADPDAGFSGTLGERIEGGAATIGVTRGVGEELAAAVEAAAEAEETVLGSLTVEKEFTETETFNVLASTTAGDPDEVIIAGAHLDGVDEGPGVNDNASGSAALLALAEQIAAYDYAPDRQVRLAFWGAEEIGLLGSYHYVEDLTANDPAELERIQAYLNYDMIGSDNFVVSVYDADESTYTAPVPIPEGSIELEQIYTDYFDSVDQPWVDSEFSGRSDYQAFILADIPSGGLFSGADGVKTEEEAELFGGTPGVQHDTNYHTINDTLENVNQESLDIFAPAIGYSTHVLAWDLVEPTEPTEPTPDPTEVPTTEPTDDPTTAPTDDPTTEPGPGGAPQDPGAQDPSLPTTGADMLPLAATALLLIVMGALIAASSKARYRQN